MKNFEFKKIGQTMIEFMLVMGLVGLVSFGALYKLNPGFFRSYFQSSVPASSNIDANGQLKLCSYDDNTCNPVTAAPPTAGCVAITIGATQADGVTKYAGPIGPSGVALCTTAADSSVSMSWNTGVHLHHKTGATSSNNGQINTSNLVSATDIASPYRAALICSSLNIGGYTDWYLPSRSELSGLHVNRIAIGGFAASRYWSSTESDKDEAITVRFDAGGSISKEDKNDSYRVRCVRHD